MENLRKILAVVILSAAVVFGGVLSAGAKEDDKTQTDKKAASDLHKFKSSGSKVKHHSNNDSLFKKTKHFGEKKKPDEKKKDDKGKEDKNVPDEKPKS